ncbi:MAG: ABC transporter ATP-binding protein [Vulcanimicrobiota bacterium]
MIIIDNLSKIYKIGDVEVRAISGVSFHIKMKEFVSIMGPSGSGKSTCLHILGCLDRPTAGSYKLDGREVSRLSDSDLAKVRNKKIGFVFQNFNLLPKATALQNVELPLIYAGVGKRTQRCREALARVGLGKRIKHKPIELSGGEQQRVAIARALVNDPAILLADEPTGNLDSRSGKEIMAIFSELYAQGITIVIITHDRGVAEYGSRIIHFKDGLIINEETLSKDSSSLERTHEGASEVRGSIGGSEGK